MRNKTRKLLAGVVAAGIIVQSSLGSSLIYAADNNTKDTIEYIVTSDESFDSADINMNPDSEYEAENDPLYQNNEVSVYSSDLYSNVGASLGDNIVHDTKYKNYKRIYGIDVSKWNATIDWNKVKKSGVDYAIIRVGYRGSANGTLTIDTKFEENIKGAHDAGIDVGIYFFTQAITTSEAKKEAAFTAKCLSKYSSYVNYPVFIDIEDLAGGRMEKAKLTNKERTNICKAFCNEIEKQGYNSGVYANKYWMTNLLNMDSLLAYNIWLARYNKVAEYEGYYDMWQFSSTGKVSGISGNCDLNVKYKAINPDKPVGINQTSATTGSVSVEWKSVSNADGYKIYLTDSKGNLVYSQNTSNNYITIDSLKKGTSYYVKLKAYYYGADGEKKFSKCSSDVTVSTLPGTVTSVTTSKSDTAVVLKYGKVSGAVGYGILKYNDATGTYERIANTTATSYKVQGLNPETTYRFKVQPYIKLNGETKFYASESEEAVVRTLTRAVSNLSYNDVTTNSYKISWEEPDVVDGYEVLQYDSKGKVISNWKVAECSLILENLKSAVAYSHKVRAYHKLSDGSISYSPYKTVYVATRPKQVKNLSAKNNGTSKIKLSWSKVSGADAYRIYKYNSATKKRTKIADTKKLTYTVSKLSSSTKYSYIVCAYKKSGDAKFISNDSEIKSAYTSPLKVSGVKMKSRTKHQVKMTWKNQKNASGYKVLVYNTKGKIVKKYYSTTNNCTINGLSKNTKYHVNVVACVKMSNGKKLYGEYSGKVTIKTKK